jgi:hypothetical protein
MAGMFNSGVHPYVRRHRNGAAFRKRRHYRYGGGQDRGRDSRRTVAATNDATGITTTTTTTGAGDFNFSNLDPGIYTVTTTAKGFEKLSQKNIHVNAMESQAYNPVLTVGGADEEITVTAAPPQLETSNATLGATMEHETYAELPIEMGAYGSADQRRATDFVYLMPGVQGNETNGNATTNVGVVNGSGSRGAASAVYIDGIPFVRAGGNGDPRYVWTAISVDAVDQFQVQTTGYSAIYEGQGVMNYSIKQGGAKYHGSVYEFFRNTALDTWGWFGKIPNPATGVPVKPGRAQQRVRHQCQRSADSVGLLEGKGLLLRQLQRLPLQQRDPDADDLSRLRPSRPAIFSASGLPAIYDPSSRRPPAPRITTPPKLVILPVSVRLRAAGTTTGARQSYADRRCCQCDPVHPVLPVAKNMQAFLPGDGASARLCKTTTSLPTPRAWSIGP